MNNDCEPLTQDDREILSDMLFPIFETAGKKNRNVTRENIREALTNIFPWPHVAEVLEELEEKDYIQTMTTRGGGVYNAGEKFALWVEEMKPLDEVLASEPRPTAEPVSLSPAEAENLVALVRELAGTPPTADAVGKVRAAIREDLSPANILKLLSQR